MDKIATSLPVNSTAGKVVSKGTHFTPQHKPHVGFVRSDVQPPIRTWDERTGRDLTGTRFGRMTVVGYSAQNRGKWVVKCQCGMYEFRRGKAILNPNNNKDRCLDCRQTFYITHGYSTDDTRQLTREQRLRQEAPDGSNT